MLSAEKQFTDRSKICCSAFRPTLQAERCLNRKQDKFTCTVCTELCAACRAKKK